MAKIEAELYGNFDIILMDLHNTVMRGSTSASLEESSDIVVGSTRCALRAYERYSENSFLDTIRPTVDRYRIR